MDYFHPATGVSSFLRSGHKGQISAWRNPVSPRKTRRESEKAHPTALPSAERQGIFLEKDSSLSDAFYIVKENFNPRMVAVQGLEPRTLRI